MDRARFKLWIDDMYEREGLMTLTDREADAEDELLTLEEEQDKWLAELDFEDEEYQVRKRFES